MKTKTTSNSSTIRIILYYGVCLIILVGFQFGNFLPNTYQTFIGINLTLTLYTSIYVAYYWKQLHPLLHISTVKWKPLLSMVILVLLVGLLVYFLPHWNNTFTYHTNDQLILVFWDSNFPRLYSLLFLCIQPALFEELAFRGFLFNHLIERFSVPVSIFLSAFLFASLHLSVFLLLWLLPIGMLFAYFRHKYNSLWYSITGHFCYNFTIIFLDFYYNWSIVM
ncbi:MAG: lysostaphin resistance A-like protein [Flammeovirgaceae bacterium]